MIFFLLGNYPTFKILLGAHSPYLTLPYLTLPLPYSLTWGISSEYDCVKNLGCGMKIKFIKNCRVCFRILENAWRAFSFILVIIVDLRWLITVFRWHHCLFKLGHSLDGIDVIKLVKTFLMRSITRNIVAKHPKTGLETRSGLDRKAM